MWKWNFMFILPISLLVVLVGSLRFSTSLAYSEGATQTHQEWGKHTESTVDLKAPQRGQVRSNINFLTHTSRPEEIVSSGSYTGLAGQLVITTLQVGDGSQIVIAMLSVSDSITVSLYADNNEHLNQSPLTSTVLVSGTYKNLPLVIPKDQRPPKSTLYRLEILKSGTIIAAESIPVELQLIDNLTEPHAFEDQVILFRTVRTALDRIIKATSGSIVSSLTRLLKVLSMSQVEPELAVVNAFTVTTPQVGNGSRITVANLSVNAPVTVALHADEDGQPSMSVITSTQVVSGTRDNLGLIIPEDSHPTADTHFWVQLFEPDTLTATHRLSVELLLSGSESELTVVNTFMVTTPQVGDGSRITVTTLSINAPVTVSLHTDDGGALSEFPLTSTLVMSGVYNNLVLTIPEDSRPTADTRFWIQLFQSDTLTVTQPISMELQLSNVKPEFAAVNAFTVTTPQIGDGTHITVADLSINAPMTVSLHTDEEGKPSEFSLFSTLVMSGSYEDLALAIPEENRPTANARFWIQIFESDIPTASKHISVELQLSRIEPELKVVNSFTVTTSQIGNGSYITVADLSVSETVTVSLYNDENGTPSEFPLTSTVVMSGTHKDLMLTIPEENRPTANARFWIQIFEPDIPTASKRISVELQLETEPKVITSDIITVTTLQIGDGSRIMIDRLSVTNAVTVTLYEDDSGVPSQLPITSTVFAEDSYENVSLMIPEDSQPVQNSVFWIQVYNTGTITAAVSISVMFDLNIGVIGDFVIDPQQVGDGSTITLTKLVVYQGTILVGVLGSDPTEQQIKPDDVRVLQSIPGPSRYKNIPIFIPNEKRPMEDSRLWVRLYKEADNPATSPQPVDLILHTVITDFIVQTTQKSNGIVLDKVNASKPITVIVRDEHDTLISSMLLEGHRVHENVSLPIPETSRPNQDAQYWVELYAGETAEPLRSEEITLDLDPILDIKLSTRQQNNGSKVTLDLLQVSEPVQITLHSDDQQQPSSHQITHIGLSKPGKYDNLSFAIPQSVELAEETVFWYRFLDSQGTEAREPISVTLVTAASLRPDLNIINEQYGDGSQIEIANLKADIPLILGLYNDDNGVPSSSLINRLSVRSGEYPNILTPEIIIPIPEESRPITDTTYWMRIYDTNLKEVIEPISVTLALLPVISDFEVISPQVGNGDVITVTKLKIIEPITLTLYSATSNEPGTIITQTRVDVGDHSDILLPIPPTWRPVEDTTFWIAVQNQRQTEPVDSTSVILDLPPIFELAVAEEQENDGSFIEVAKLAVSENVTASIIESFPLTNTVVYTQTFTPGIHENLMFDISAERRISNTVYLLEIIDDGGTLLHSPITISLSVKLPPPVKPVILVRDQERVGFNAIFDRVATPKDAWVAVYEQQSKNSQLIGYARAHAGENEKFPVFFNHQVPRGSVLSAVLYEDIGEVGKFEYPNIDPPFKQNDEFVATSFVLGLPTIEVDSDQVISRSVIVRELIAPHDGWLSIYDKDGQQLLGYKPVPMGRSEGLLIPFNVQMPTLGEADLIAILHQDNGERNNAELPVPDSVSLIGGKTITKEFTAIVEPLTCGLTGTGYSYIGDEPFLTVDAPIQLSDYTLQVHNLCLPKDGWVAIYRDADGFIGDLIGYSQIVGGAPPDTINIDLTPPRPFGQPVWIILHADMGQTGRFELPEPDLPIWINGKPAVVRAIVGQPSPSIK